MILFLMFLVADPNSILVVRSATTTYETFNIAFERELEADDGHFSAKTLVAERGQRYDEFVAAMAAQPKVVLLVDRWPVTLYRRWLKEHLPPGQAPPPTVLVYNVQIDRDLKRLNNVTGIRFNIPAVTGIINLRSISPGIKRVGVLYRPILETQFQREKKLAEREGIELIGHAIPLQPKVNEVKAGLRALKRAKVDAFWLFNDPHMLTADLLSQAWIPRVKQYRIPVIVGVDSLMGRVKLGNLAIFPDIEGLASQTYQIMIDLEDNQWHAGDIPVQHPLSVKKYFNRANWPRRMFINDTILNSEFDAIISLE